MGGLEKVFFFLLLLFLPTQLGRHFWPAWTQVLGLRVDYLSPTVYLTDLFLLALFFSSLPVLTPLFRKKYFLFFGAALLIFLTLGIINSANYLAGFYQLIKWLGFGFWGFYLAQKINPANFSKITLLLSGGVILEALLTLAQFLNQGSIGGIFWWLGERTFSGQTPGIAQAEIGGELLLRPYATFPHPNVLAGYLVVTLALIIGISQKSKWTRFIRWLAIVLGTTALFFTFSRTGWLVGFAMALVYFVVQKKWLPLFLSLILLLSGLSLVGSRLATLFSTDQESWQVRHELNLAAGKMIKAQPLWGVGLGNFLVELPNYYQEQRAVRFLQPAHNLYLMAGVELGLPILVAFLGFLFLTYRRLIKQSPPVLLISLSAILFLSLFDHYFYTLQQGRLLLATILGLSWVGNSSRS